MKPSAAGDRAYLRALAAAGVMSGIRTVLSDRWTLYPPAAVIISGLADRGWIKMAEGRRYIGLISGISTQRGRNLN